MDLLGVRDKSGTSTPEDEASAPHSVTTPIWGTRTSRESQSQNLPEQGVQSRSTLSAPRSGVPENASLFQEPSIPPSTPTVFLNNNLVDDARKVSMNHNESQVMTDVPSDKPAESRLIPITSTDSAAQRYTGSAFTWSAPPRVVASQESSFILRQTTSSEVSTARKNVTYDTAFSSAGKVPAEKLVAEARMNTNAKETDQSALNPSSKTEVWAAQTVDSFHRKESDQRFAKERLAWTAPVQQANIKVPPKNSDKTNTGSSIKSSADNSGRVAVKLKQRKTEEMRESALLFDTLIPPDNTTGGTPQIGDSRKKDTAVKFRRTKHKRGVPSKKTRDYVPATTDLGALYGSLMLDEQRRINQREICLFALAILAVIVIVAFLVLLFVNPVAKAKDKTEFGFRFANTCSSLSCTHSAAYLSNLLSWDINPCENFYMFVCNQWTNQFSVSGGVFPISTDDDYAGELEDRIYSLLADEKQTGVTPAMRKLFEQCQDAKRIEDGGWNSLLELLAQVSLPGFPFTPPVRNLSAWKLAAKVLRKTGVAAFCGVGITSHPSKSQDIVALRLPETLSRAGGADISEIIRSYAGAVQASFKALKKDFIPSVHSLNVVRFASQLEKLYQLHSGDQNFSIQVVVSKSTVDVFLAEVFRDVSPSRYQAKNAEVLVESPAFSAELEKLVLHTDTPVVMNFLGVRLMVQVSPFLPDSDLLDVYSSMMYHKPRLGVPRWKICVRTVEKALAPPFLYLSLRDIWDRGLEAKLAVLVIEIKQKFLSSMESLDYLNEASKAVIRSLISKTRFEIFCASWMREESLLEKFVGNLLLSSGQNVLESYVVAHEYVFVDMLRRRSSEQWPRSAFSTDCWHEPGSRTIYVPMLVFNVSLAQNADMALLQLSRAGVRIGCCIFDMLISEASSPYASQQWLNDDTRSKLATLQGCIGDFQGSHKMAALRDASVTRFAYRHFEKVYNSSGNPLRLRLAPNRDLAGEQLFFIYLVLQSCEKLAGGASASTTGVNWNTAIRHQHGFHDAFHCIRGSAMHPEQSCNV